MIILTFFTNVLLWLPYWYVNVAFLLYTCMSIFYMWYFFLQTKCFSDNLEITIQAFHFMYGYYEVWVWDYFLWLNRKMCQKSFYTYRFYNCGLSLLVLTLKMLYYSLCLINVWYIIRLFVHNVNTSIPVQTQSYVHRSSVYS